MDGRDRPGLAMAAIAGAAVVAGGLVSAVTGPLELAHGSWLAAYLVLVVGVGQAGMATARLVGPDGRPARRGWIQVGAWNLGNALVMLGTLTRQPLVVDLGGLGCVVGLLIALVHSRALAAHWVAWLYRAVLWLLAVSIPVGLVLGHVRHGS